MKNVQGQRACWCSSRAGGATRAEGAPPPGTFSGALCSLKTNSVLDKFEFGGLQPNSFSSSFFSSSWSSSSSWQSPSRETWSTVLPSHRIKIRNKQIKKNSPGKPVDSIASHPWEPRLPELKIDPQAGQQSLGHFHIIYYLMLWWMHRMWSKTIDEKPRWPFFVGPVPLSQVYKWKVCLFCLSSLQDFQSRGPLYHPRTKSDPTYHILLEMGCCDVSSGDDKDTHKDKTFSGSTHWRPADVGSFTRHRIHQDR